jgi:hypothetical protein
MYAHHAVLPINNLHLNIDLPAEFAGYTEAEIIILPIVKKNKPTKKTLAINELNQFFAQIPKLADEMDAFAEDLKTIRQQLPLEANQWD